MKNQLAFPAPILAAIFGVIARRQQSLPLQPLNETSNVGRDRWTASLSSDRRSINVRFMPGQRDMTGHRDKARRIETDIANLEPHTKVQWADNDPDAKRKRSEKGKAIQRLKALQAELHQVREAIQAIPQTERWELPLADLMESGDWIAIPKVALPSEEAEAGSGNAEPSALEAFLCDEWLMDYDPSKPCEENAIELLREVSKEFGCVGKTLRELAPEKLPDVPSAEYTPVSSLVRAVVTNLKEENGTLRKSLDGVAAGIIRLGEFLSVHVPDSYKPTDSESFVDTACHVIRYLMDENATQRQGLLDGLEREAHLAGTIGGQTGEAEGADKESGQPQGDPGDEQIDKPLELFLQEAPPAAAAVASQPEPDATKKKGRRS